MQWPIDKLGIIESGRQYSDLKDKWTSWLWLRAACLLLLMDLARCLLHGFCWISEASSFQAPEIIMRNGTSKEADYWALGILIFEMLVGEPPFKSLSGDPWDTFRRTLSGRYFVPASISSAAADLIYKLLQVVMPELD